MLNVNTVYGIEATDQSQLTYHSVVGTGDKKITAGHKECIYSTKMARGMPAASLYESLKG